jgi:ribosomal protein L11 methyltransferase
VRRLRFELPREGPESALDALLPLLPGGARVGDGGEITAVGAASRMPSRADLETALGAPLAGYAEDDVPADWRHRRPRSDVLVAGRVVVRAPEDPAPDGDVLDVVLESQGGFGSGAHPTTRMCIELMLGLEPGGGFADIGTGAGTLAILAARLGFAPVVAVDREPGAVESAQRNAALNGVELELEIADAEAVPPPAVPVVAINAPPSVHERVAARLSAHTRAVLVSGAVGFELDAVLGAYAAAGLQPVRRIDADAVWSAVLVERA